MDVAGAATGDIIGFGNAAVEPDADKRDAITAAEDAAL